MNGSIHYVLTLCCLILNVLLSPFDHVCNVVDITQATYSTTDNSDWLWCYDWTCLDGIVQTHDFGFRIAMHESTGHFADSCCAFWVIAVCVYGPHFCIVMYLFH